MEHLPAALRAQIPALYAQDDSPDPIAYLKYTNTQTGWIWYVTEFNGEDTFFGLVQGFKEELGYFSLSELMLNDVQRDLNFTPTPVSQLRSS
jgi:Protein of unknown function (DUF2958)